MSTVTKHTPATPLPFSASGIVIKVYYDVARRDSHGAALLAATKLGRLFAMSDSAVKQLIEG